jgi:hypothetical protein
LNHQASNLSIFVPFRDSTRYCTSLSTLAPTLRQTPFKCHATANLAEVRVEGRDFRERIAMIPSETHPNPFNNVETRYCQRTAASVLIPKYLRLEVFAGRSV